MSSRTVIEGNAFYEVDEECLKQKEFAKDQAQKAEEMRTKYRTQQTKEGHPNDRKQESEEMLPYDRKQKKKS